jgi:hypothetical protein
MDLSGLDLEGMLKDLNRWAGRQAKRQKARSLGEQGASRTEIRERAGEDWAARIERERAKKARKARARKKRAEAGLAVYNPRRARRNTGYVAAKIRANTARKNPRLRDRFVFQAVRQKWGWGILYSSGPDFSYGQDETLGVVGTQEAMEELARDLNAGDKKALSWVNQKMREHYVGERPQKIRANTAKRNGLIPKKSPTGARPTVPKGDFTFLDFGPVALLAGEKSVEAVMLEGDYLWRDAALSRLKRMGFSSSEARSYLSSLPNIGAAVYSP